MHKLFFDLAIRIGNESKSKRLKVGAVIVKNNRILSTGYNGLPSGFTPDILEDESGHTKSEVIHAELNAIINAAREGTSIKGSNLYITHSPCKHCTSLIIQSGIVNVYYLKEYKDNTGIDYLKSYIKNVKQFDYLNYYADER